MSEKNTDIIRIVRKGKRLYGVYGASPTVAISASDNIFNIDRESVWNIRNMGTLEQLWPLASGKANTLFAPARSTRKLADRKNSRILSHLVRWPPKVSSRKTTQRFAVTFWYRCGLLAATKTHSTDLCLRFQRRISQKGKLWLLIVNSILILS